VPLSSVFVTLLVGALSAAVGVLGERLRLRHGRRSETMALLRWAGELAISGADRSAAGVGIIDALLNADLTDRKDLSFIRAVAAAIAGAKSTGSRR